MSMRREILCLVVRLAIFEALMFGVTVWGSGP